jgi:bla regulator protein BlaR1
MSMAGLVNYLANVLGSPVHDETGLPGHQYNFELDFVYPGRPSPSADAPDLFEAVQVQFGLKLVGKKGPAEVLVVDHAERATAN